MPPVTDVLTGLSLAEGVTLTTVLSVVAVAVLQYLNRIPPRLAFRLEVIRRYLWPALDPFAASRGRPLVRDKTDSREQIETVETALLPLLRALWGEGYRWNPISTKKHITQSDGTRQWSVMSVAKQLPNDKQHHVYIFSAGDGRWQLWGHTEASITDADDHLGGDDLTPAPGDVPAALERL